MGSFDDSDFSCLTDNVRDLFGDPIVPGTVDRRLNLGDSDSQVFPIIIGGDRQMLYEQCRAMNDAGLFLAPVDYPSVSEDSLLRKMTALEPGWEDAVQAFIARPENADRAAYFGFRLDERAVMARLLEAVVALRCRLLGLPYGDQGLLIAREHYLRLGGFRQIPLMEDVDIVRRIAGGGSRRCPATP